MITKEEAINKLKKAGYNVVDEGSVVTIIISEKASVKNTVKSVKELFLKIDYQASFGVKQHSGAIGETNGESDSEENQNEFDDVINDYSEESEDISEVTIEDNQADEPEDESPVEDKPVKKATKSEKSVKTEKASGKKTSGDKKAAKAKEKDNDEFFDDEDETLDDVSTIKLDDLDMDMMLNEDSVQFSLEDFGLF